MISNEVSAKKVFAKSIDELKVLVNKATKGDSVLLMNGTYKDAGLVNINSNAVVILAEKSGEVILKEFCIKNI